MADPAEGLPPAAIRWKTPPRALNVTVPVVTAAERADTAPGAVAAGELSAETFEQPS